ncbi:amino acid ABC transporter substrate-binding protein [Virgibacillus profundi]|uniref:Amino acid ABC transporter substrate-binding protein n=1 Tax=Virgibacillus profundi TaxID=2024555 RepID=A0A2A2IH26_9BACI|nr:ABC transporter substrate-binding protein [Virgibacillus profundi]PAV30842.1 amino acid ABC transporter substrate-binding protein [Virgibacillus profundi]PXY55025.1 amino acid ABC transporter substrate-binding protein [Virgibacillus profundi]
MRKFLLVFLALISIIVITACGDSEEASGSEEGNLLSDIEESGVLRVGFEGTYPPFNFLEGENYDGFDVDIANELADRLGVETEFFATKWDSLIGGLDADKFDVIIAQMTVTEERKKNVDFTDPYVVTGSVLITREDTEGISVLEDIKGKKVGVGGGTTFEEVANSVDGADVKLYKSVNDYIQDLLNERLDVIINDQLLMSYNIQEEELPVKIVSDILNKDEIGMAVKKGSDELVERLNQELADMKEDGTYEEIYKKWFDSDPLIK